MPETSTPSLDLLWNLSEIERKLSANPDAKGYLKLAAGYAEAGWPKEATRAAQRATALSHGKPAEETGGASFSGPCTPRVLVELLRALHFTRKSGELRLEAPGDIFVSLTLVKGNLIDAQSSDVARGEPSLTRAGGLRASQYTFFPGKPRGDSSSLTGNTAELIGSLAARLSN